MRIYPGKRFSIFIPQNVSKEMLEYLNKSKNVSKAMMELMQEALNNRKERTLEERIGNLEELFKNKITKGVGQQVPEDIDKLIEQMKSNEVGTICINDDFPD